LRTLEKLILSLFCGDRKLINITFIHICCESIVANP
jgi:hypothetical protein